MKQWLRNCAEKFRSFYMGRPDVDEVTTKRKKGYERAIPNWNKTILPYWDDVRIELGGRGKNKFCNYRMYESDMLNSLITMGFVQKLDPAACAKMINSAMLNEGHEMLALFGEKQIGKFIGVISVEGYAHYLRRTKVEAGYLTYVDVVNPDHIVILDKATCKPVKEYKLEPSFMAMEIVIPDMQYYTFSEWQTARQHIRNAYKQNKERDQA